MLLPLPFAFLDANYCDMPDFQYDINYPACFAIVGNNT
jgi:hypothetical protein